ncbi:uncharacterized protein LOC141668464 [Apium graveolens]|uniref:uncharacterized protein LOC141668464 n=1 Tax=Apium graveolens TaxID=4045 RepID=UPI003D78F5F1
MRRSGYECMKLLLENLKDLIKIADDYGWTAFHYAAYNGVYGIVEVLVSVDKSVGYLVEKEYKRTPLHIAAAYRNYPRMLMELAKCYPDCWEVVDGNGQNILHLAVEQYIANPGAVLMVNHILSRGFEASNNLLNQRNNDGITPLHMIAESGFYAHELMEPAVYDWVVDWDVVDNKHVTPQDVLHDRHIMTSPPKLIQRSHRGLVLGKNSRLLNIIRRKHIDRMRVYASKEVEYLNGKKDDEIIEGYRRAINTHMIVAALITTVALTAGFAMPGGFDGNEGPTQGSPILIKKTAFKIFIATDTIALLFSLSSLFLYFIATWYEDASRVEVFIVVSALLSIFSITSMMVAFITGTYAVLAPPSPATAISVCVISSFFFLLVLYMCTKIYTRVLMFFKYAA